MFERFFGKNKKIDPETARRIDTLLASDNARPADEQRLAMLLGVKREMLHDDFVEGAMEADSIVAQKNSAGEVTGVEMNLHSLGTRFMLSQRILTSILEPIEAEIQKSNARLEMINNEACMSKSTYIAGGYGANSAALMLIEVALESAKRGDFVKILNTIAESRSYTVRQMAPEKEKAFRGG